MKIGGIQKTSLIDFPGRVAAVLFTQGCNMRCPYCHNPSLVLAKQFEEPVDEKELFDYLERRRGKLDGVVISGGEPSVHRDLPDFIRRIRAMGYKIKLDTNGSNPFVLKYLLEGRLLDFVAMDLKGAPDCYEKYCGAAIPTESINASIHMLMSGEVDYEFRTTAVPGLHTLEDLKALCECIRGARSYAIQAFKPGSCLKEDYCTLPAYDMSDLIREKEWFEARVKHFELRGAPERIEV
ncbi:MAG: anaerobic ribonucleoside-triphosphate reductase activating protein [Opitutales bacterium]|nr:anaerobic ribonucleoside-triphosphate reductase activating protein [Opitutales bacterium]